MRASLISPHFKDPVHDAQAAFRGLLKAMSRPGTRVPLSGPSEPPAPLGGPLAAIALTLTDTDSPVWLDSALDSDDVHRYLHIHTNAPRVLEPNAAAFALVAAPMGLPHFSAFAAGEAAYPDRSATLVIQVPALTGGPSVTLCGPGIENSVTIAPCSLPGWFWPAWGDNAGRYPLGIDILFVDDRSVVGLPRTTKVEIR